MIFKKKVFKNRINHASLNILKPGIVLFLNLKKT